MGHEFGELPGPRAPLAPNAGWDEDWTDAGDALGSLGCDEAV